MYSLEMRAFAPDKTKEQIKIMPDITTPDELPDLIKPEEVVADVDYVKPVVPEFKAPSLEIPLERTIIEFDHKFKNMKDPSFTMLPDGRCLLLVSTNDTDLQSGWKQFAYIAQDVQAPIWNKLGEVSFKGIEPKFVDEYGEEVERTLCAAGAFPNGEGLVVQDLCFHDGGNIHLFKGNDPTNLEYVGLALKSDSSKGIAGVYDPEPVSGNGPTGGVISSETGEEEFFISATTVGSYRIEIDRETGRRLYFPQEGSIWLAKRKESWTGGEYKFEDSPILSESQVTGHGHKSTLEGGEWVMEGGKISELSDDVEEFYLIHQSRTEDGSWRIELATIKMDDLRNLMDKKGAGKRFLHYFTAFVDGPQGSRQRGFLASSDRLDQSPVILGTIEPLRKDGEFKETGHGTLQFKRKINFTDLSQAA